MKKIITITLLLLFTLIGCDNKKASLGYYSGTPYAALSSLFNNRMLLLLKGTYATDNPLDFGDYSNGTGQLYQDVNGATGDPTFDLQGLPTASALNHFIDIGEVRISSRADMVGAVGIDGIQNLRDSKKFWNYIAPERQVYCTTIYAFAGSTCESTGFFKIQDFFSDNGVAYPSNDPSSGNSDGLTGNPRSYYYSGIYVRNYVTGWARELNTTITNTRFDNFQILSGGVNIVPRNSYVPNATNQATATPAMFPVFYQVGQGHNDFDIRPGFDPYILEIRMNIKENLMVHSYVSALGNVQTLIGISDWRYVHNGESDMGGNVLSRARVIYPETAHSLYITGGTASKVHYYNIYRMGETEFTKQLPLIATPVKQGTSKIKYIHDGDYRIRCMADTTPMDGVPETLVRETTFSASSYPFRQSIYVDLQCP